MATSTEHSVFSPDVPADLEHASVVREEALDWLESAHPEATSLSASEVLRMAGEQGRRWLATRLRKNGIGEEESFSPHSAADALTVLFLRSKGVKFAEAIQAVVSGRGSAPVAERTYGGVWSRLTGVSLGRLRNLLPARLLGAVVSCLLADPRESANCLVVVKIQDGNGKTERGSGPIAVGHEEAYRSVWDHPIPSCAVTSPSGEVFFLGEGQSPAMSEFRTRRFVRFEIVGAEGAYELLLGTLRPTDMADVDGATFAFIGRLLDVIFHRYGEFERRVSAMRVETTAEPVLRTEDDLQLWLVTQLLATVYPGSLVEISEITAADPVGRVLASSLASPWEPSPWDPPRSLDMLSGYSSRVNVPLIVDTVEHPVASVIASVDAEILHLRNSQPEARKTATFSAMSFPINTGRGGSLGSLYAIGPQPAPSSMRDVVRLFTVFARIIGEMIERQRAAYRCTTECADIARSVVLDETRFKAALVELLARQAREITGDGHLPPDARLPLLVLSAYAPEADEADPRVVGPLRDWLGETLEHLPWRSFLRSHLADEAALAGLDGMMGRVSPSGVVIAIDRLVSKDELDRLRNAFPTEINKLAPTNAPVKFVAWVLDVPAERIASAAEAQGLETLADQVQHWAVEVAAVVDDVAQSHDLAYEQGAWDAALRRVRRGIQKDAGRANGYLYRRAVDCCFALGDWPSALKYAQEAASVSRQEMGSGLVRSLCQEADAYLCLGDPVRAWAQSCEAVGLSSVHPLPRYYRGQGLLLMARLLRVFEDEGGSTAGQLEEAEKEKLGSIVSVLVHGAVEDLTLAADRLEKWGLIPESYQYNNFHLVPGLVGQGTAYLLSRMPGPAASRFQSARRSFPKDDLILREFLFAKCWEQGVHRRCGEVFLGPAWGPLEASLRAEFGEGVGRG